MAAVAQPASTIVCSDGIRPANWTRVIGPVNLAVMDRATFDDYIARFNAQDTTAFDTYIAPDMRMLNGQLRLDGVQGMKDHYALIWSTFTESLTIERFVSDDETAAVQMWAHFEALGDDADSLFGPVSAGDGFDFRGLIMYRIAGGKFTHITVAYNSFTYTGADGVAIERGIPH